jgi:ApaG protein
MFIGYDFRMAKYQMLVSAIPKYLPHQSSPMDDVYTFAYTIEIINSGKVGVQVVSRYWSVNDANGLIQKVKGLGVVGRQPYLKPGESFEYTSGTRIGTSSGTMHGSFFCVAEDGERFDVDVPLFVLDAVSPDAGQHSFKK